MPVESISIEIYRCTKRFIDCPLSSVGLNNRQMYETKREEMQIKSLIVIALWKAVTVNETFI